MKNYSIEGGGDDVLEDDISDVTDSMLISQKTPSSAYVNQFQQLIASRRTVSNFISRPSSDESSDRQFLHEAISRGVQLAATGPNHKLSEPTTFHRILTPSDASSRLSDIAYEVTLQRLIQNKLSGEEACRSEAMRKREKWSTIPAFVAVTVSGMEDQTSGDTASGGGDPYKELPYVPPTTIRQLEDYASACASIQNLLLSLHSECLGAKWATGPVINTHAFRELIQCRQNEMVAGLIMVGWPNQLPRMRRRRGLEGDVLRDVIIFGADE
jgi:nitroreductase